MSDRTPPPVSQPPDWQDTARREYWARRGNGAWVLGTILIVLGCFLLARNLGFFLPHNWWAVFLLIPAAGSFASAWSMYNANGRQMTMGVRGAILGGIILVLLAAAFYWEFDWGKYWPVILILLGVSAIGGAPWRR